MFQINLTKSDPVELSSSSCSCMAGKGIWNHKIALFYTIAHLKSSGYKVTPPVFTKTSVSQKWHVPLRTRRKRAEEVKSLNFQSPVEKSKKSRKRTLKKRQKKQLNVSCQKYTTPERRRFV